MPTWDGAAFAACAKSFSTAALADGSHTLDVARGRCRRQRGRDARDLHLGRGPDRPETTIVTPEPNPTNDPTGDFVFGSDDASATFECRVDAAAFAVCSKTFSTAALADGSHTLAVRAVRRLGNVDATPATYTWVSRSTRTPTATASTTPRKRKSALTPTTPIRTTMAFRTAVSRNTTKTAMATA